MFSTNPFAAICTLIARRCFQSLEKNKIVKLPARYYSRSHVPYDRWLVQDSIISRIQRTKQFIESHENWFNPDAISLLEQPRLSLYIDRLRTVEALFRQRREMKIRIGSRKAEQPIEVL
jgi:hypothetical protein